jgi:hypothetical protein
MNLTAFSATGSYEHWLIISSTATMTTPISGQVAAANVGLVDRIHLLDSINFGFPVGSDVAIVGHGNSSRLKSASPAAASPPRRDDKPGEESKRRGNRETTNSISVPASPPVSAES